MPYLRKKALVIEGFQLTTEIVEALNYQENPEDTLTLPGWFWEGFAKAFNVPGTICVNPLSLDIFTLEGTHRADIGDWIVQGVTGELYPIKPDIVAITYDLVAAPEAPAQGETE